MLKQYKLRNYHFQLVVSILVLNIIGILIIGSAKHSVQKMQILGCIIGMVAMVIVSLMDYSFILRFTWLYYIGIIVLLGLVMTGIGDSAVEHSAGLILEVFVFSLPSWQKSC